MFISLNNIELNYEISGEEKPLLLLHGNGEDLHIFDKLKDKLKLHYKVYCIDSRNHGLSSKTDDFSYQTMANDIFQFISILGLNEPSIVGFSDGAIIAALLAVQDPILFSKMVLLGFNITPLDFETEIYRSLVTEYNKTKDPLLALMLNEPNISLKQLATIETPSLIIAGENDIFTADSFVKIDQAISNSTLKIMKGHDHGSYIINSDILYPTLKEFL